MDQVLAEAAIHLPTPTLAAAWALHVGVPHGVVVCMLFVFVEGQLIVAHELLG
jgi:hypothetical protein